ncbi:MAG: hypothetical protein R2834_11090 [Rhodothermales bacterium]
MKRPLLQLKFEVRSLLAREPGLRLFYQPFIWWAQRKAVGHIDPSECTINAGTEFVIDGFQGSGNSFATVAFKRSQERPLRLAHHLHSPAQIIQAAKAGLPVLITIREPRGAAISLVSRWPYVSLRQAVRGYIHFYEKIMDVAPACVISPFDMTTNHLDEVIEAVNARYGKDFGVFQYTEANMNALRDPEQLGSEGEQRRKEMKAAMKAELQKPSYAALLKRAEAVYQQIAALGIARRESSPAKQRAGV